MRYLRHTNLVFFVTRSSSNFSVSNSNVTSTEKTAETVVKNLQNMAKNNEDKYIKQLEENIAKKAETKKENDVKSTISLESLDSDKSSPTCCRFRI